VAAFSFGGGVQSTAALVMARRGQIDFRTFLFANVGDDSEHPDTLDYVRNVAMPYAAEHGLELVELGQHTRRDGTTRTLLQHIQLSAKSVVIPARMDNGAPGKRTCTYDFKILVIGRELKRRGASRTNPARVGWGFRWTNSSACGRRTTNAAPNSGANTR